MACEAERRALEVAIGALGLAATGLTNAETAQTAAMMNYSVAQATYMIAFYTVEIARGTLLICESMPQAVEGKETPQEMVKRATKSREAWAKRMSEIEACLKRWYVEAEKMSEPIK